MSREEESNPSAHGGSSSDEEIVKVIDRSSSGDILQFQTADRSFSARVTESYVDRDAGLLKLFGSVGEETQLATPHIWVIGESGVASDGWHTLLQYREQTEASGQRFERVASPLESAEITEKDTFTAVPGVEREELKRIAASIIRIIHTYPAASSDEITDQPDQTFDTDQNDSTKLPPTGATVESEVDRISDTPLEPYEILTQLNSNGIVDRDRPTMRFLQELRLISESDDGYHPVKGVGLFVDAVRDSQ